MALNETAQKAAQSIEKTLADYGLSQEQKLEILKIIGDSLIETVEKTTATHREATVICCGPEADLAHKIQEEVDRKIAVLISNLQAMR